MSKLFFDHLYDVERLRIRLYELELVDVELQELEDKIDGLIQQRVVEVILDLIDERHHEKFVALLHEAPGDEKILLWLKGLVVDIEERIKDAIEKVEEELLLEFGEEIEV